MYIGFIGNLDTDHFSRRKCRRNICACDACQRWFCINAGSDRIAKKRFHFCSRACQAIAHKKDSILELAIRNSCKDIHGVDYHVQLESLKKKHTDDLLRLYGVINISQLESVKEKKRRTCLEHLGVESTFASSVVREKSKQTCISRYGVDHPMMLQSTKDKIKQTNFERYDAKSFQSSKYCDHEAIVTKQRATMKKNNSYAKSKPEDRFYEILCLIFDQNDIERKKRINKWHIDFYIKSIETYIQFDGVYWHGLNRPIEQIREHKQKRDIKISHCYDNDIKQNQWFVANNLKLVRITDAEFKNKSKHQEIIDRIMNCNKRDNNT